LSEEVGLDELDIKIIDMLQRNARISFRKMAKILGVSPQTVSNRVAKLRKKGVILGFVAITDPVKLGKGLLTFIEVNVRPGHSEAVAREITRIRKDITVYETIGHHDLVIYGFFKDHKDLAEFINNKLSKIREVERISIDLCFKRY